MRNLLKSARGARQPVRGHPFQRARREAAARDACRCCRPNAISSRASMPAHRIGGDPMSCNAFRAFTAHAAVASSSTGPRSAAAGCGGSARRGPLETLPAYENLRPMLVSLTWASRALENRRAFTDPRHAGRGRYRGDRGLLPPADHPRRRTICERLLRAAAVGPQRSPGVLPGRRPHGRRPRRVRAHHRLPERAARPPRATTTTPAGPCPTRCSMSSTGT